MRFIYTLIIIIFNTSCLFSQDEKKLSKKEANEEVKRLTFLIENLELENNELNNKLMIEYEKLLSEMDENSNLRIQNGEFRDEIRSMQEQLLELQKSFSKKDIEIEELNTKIKNKKSKILNDSLFNILLSDSLKETKTTAFLLENLNDSLNKKLNSLKQKIVLPYYELFKIELIEGRFNQKIKEIKFEYENPDGLHSLIGNIVFYGDFSEVLAFNLLKIEWPDYDDCVDADCTEIIISQCFCEKTENGYRPVYDKWPILNAEFVEEEWCAFYELEEWFLNYD
tara:strand:- start:108 stop:953 length:846 start_codon:yes stop_codon:yes gene_type:complete